MELHFHFQHVTEGGKTMQFAKFEWITKVYKMDYCAVMNDCMTDGCNLYLFTVIEMRSSQPVRINDNAS